MKDVGFENNALVGEIECTQFHQEDIIAHHKGWNKFFPHLGVGVADFIEDEENFDLKREIQKEFKRDGLKNIEIRINLDSKINANANY